MVYNHWFAFGARRAGKRKRRHERGATAAIVAMALIPLMLAAGVSVDLLRALSVRSSLQSAVDAAALAGASLSSRNAGTVTQTATSYFNVNGIAPAVATVGNPTVTHDTTAQTVTVSATAKMNTSLMRIIGTKTMDIAASATAAYKGTPKTKAEIVYAIDNSTSANATDWPDWSSRMSFQLSVSAHQSVNKVNSSLGSIVRYGSVPFTSYVLWSTSVGGPVPDGVGPLPTADQFIRPICSCSSTVTCEAGAYMCSAPPSSPFPPLPIKIPPNWAGCIGVREAALLASVEDAKTKPYPPVIGSCGGALRMWDLAAYNDYAGLSGTLFGSGANLTGGNTFIPGGLIWAWNMLTPEAPLTKAAPNTDDTVLKVVILITDGVNTASPLYPGGAVVALGGTPSPYYKTRAEVDALTRTVCTNMKNYGIKIYTVRAANKASDSSARQLLRDCASDPSMAYDATTYFGTPATFDTLAEAVISAVKNSGGGGPPYLVK